MTAAGPGTPHEAGPSVLGGAPGHRRYDRPGHDPRCADVDRATVPVPRPGVPAGPRVPAPPAAASGLAWLVRSVTHVPGVLHLVDGRVRFVSTRGVIVDGTAASLAITPSRTGRGVFRLTVGGERLRLHVVRFAGAVDVPDDLCRREAPGSLLTAGEPAAGTVWRTLLAPSRLRSGTPVAGGADVARTTPARTVRSLGWRPARARQAYAAPVQWC